MKMLRHKQDNMHHIPDDDERSLCGLEGQVIEIDNGDEVLVCPTCEELVEGHIDEMTAKHWSHDFAPEKIDRAVEFQEDLPMALRQKILSEGDEFLLASFSLYMANDSVDIWEVSAKTQYNPEDYLEIESDHRVLFS